jgi:hypothetical protein
MRLYGWYDGRLPVVNSCCLASRCRRPCPWPSRGRARLGGEVAMAAAMTCGEPDVRPHRIASPASTRANTQTRLSDLAPQSHSDAAHFCHLPETCIKSIVPPFRSSRRPPPAGLRAGIGDTLRLPSYHELAACTTLYTWLIRNTVPEITTHTLKWRSHCKSPRHVRARRGSFGGRCRPYRRRQSNAGLPPSPLHKPHPKPRL